MSTTSSSLTANAKYQRLVAEYQKLRTQAPLLKRAVVDEQAKNSVLTEEIKEKDQRLRKYDSEIESLTFRNQQLTKRVETLLKSIEEQQKQLNATNVVNSSSVNSNNRRNSKLSKSMRLPNSQSEYNFNNSDNSGVDKISVLEGELNRKLLENENLHKQIHEIELEHESDKKELLEKIDLLEINLSQCRDQLHQVSFKHDHVINELNAKNKELRENMRNIEAKILQRADDGAVITENHRTTQKCDNSSISTSGHCSEDVTDDAQDNLPGDQTSPNFSNFSIATSSTSDNNIQNHSINLDQKSDHKLVTELQSQISQKQRKIAELEKEREKISLENQLLRVKCEQIQKSHHQNTTTVDNCKIDHVTADDKIDILKYTEEYYGEKIVHLHIRLQEEEAKSAYFDQECKNMFKLMEMVKMENESVREKNERLSKELENLKDELETVRKGYETQLGMLTEHLAQLNSQIAKQSDQIDHLKHGMKTHVSLKRK